VSSDVDIVRQVPQAITDPDTGELVERADIERVAPLYQRIRSYLQQWREASDWCRDALIDAADERSEWAFQVGGVKVKVDPPSAAVIDWDLDELHKLESLLPAERYGELVRQVVTETPETVKLQTLARQAGPDSEVGRIILHAERRKPKARYVRVGS
jgi:hypothetical protein